MFDFKIERYCPKFILNDRNGYALGKAIEAAMQYMNDTVGDAVKLISDYDSMPEWRLDEIAWETKCLYDFHADVESKREWARNAVSLYQISGTPYALRKYLDGYFDEVEVYDGKDYEGDPFHFRVFVMGNLTPENEAWAQTAVAKAKNVRSIPDGIMALRQVSVDSNMSIIHNRVKVKPVYAEWVEIFEEEIVQEDANT